MTVLCPNLWNNEVCFKGAVLYNSEFSLTPNLDYFTPISKYGKAPNFSGKQHFTQTIFKRLFSIS